MAEKIADITDADLYEIVPAEAYSSEDLNYNDDDSRTSAEMNDPDARTASRAVCVRYLFWCRDT